MRSLRAVAVGVVTVAILTGCSVVQRTAIRLNEDGTVDFGSCETLASVSEVTANYSAESGEQFSVAADDAPDSVRQGTVIHLDAPPVSAQWDYVSVYVTDDSGDLELSGYSDREYLTVGEWRWAQSGIFFGSVDVTGCDLDD